MHVTVNGENLELAAGSSLLDLLEQVGKEPAHLAIEHNGEVLDQAGMARTVLREHDRLEIVHFVGGG